MNQRLHVRTKASLWCAGLALAVNAALGLLLYFRAWFFPPLAFFNIFVTPALALAPLCLMPSTVLQYLRPSVTAAGHWGRPRGHDYLALALGFLVALGCMVLMAYFVAVAEVPLRRMLKEKWASG